MLIFYVTEITAILRIKNNRLINRWHLQLIDADFQTILALVKLQFIIHVNYIFPIADHYCITV